MTRNDLAVANQILSNIKEIEECLENIDKMDSSCVFIKIIATNREFNKSETIDMGSEQNMIIVRCIKGMLTSKLNELKDRFEKNQFGSEQCA